MNIFEEPKIWTNYEGATEIDVSKKVSSEFVIDCINFTKKAVKELKLETKSKIIGQVRIQLNQKYGSEWQAFSVPLDSTGMLHNILNYNIICTYNDEMYISFKLNRIYYLYVQTQQEKKTNEILPIPTKLDVSPYLGKGITNIQVDPWITQEILQYSISLIQKHCNPNKTMQDNQALENIQHDMNDKFCKEWQIIIFKNHTNWAFWIISEANDQMAIQVDYFNQRIVIFKTPQERED